jgi:hypothetical protein
MLKVYSFKKLDYDQLTNYKICISVSLFKMSDPYRNFNKYVSKFLDWIYKIPSNTFVRLYTDEASLMSKEFQTIIDKEINHLEIFIYDYPEFKVSKVKSYDFHDGTFGTLMRFLPLWDKELWSKYKIDYIWVSDVDIYPNFLNTDILDMMKENKASVAYYSKACYSRPWVPDDMNFSIGAGKVIFSKKAEVSEYKFKKFLREILNGKYKWLKEKIKKYYRIINDERTLKSVIKNKYITYGFDEYYCNVILYSDIQDYKTIVQYNIDLRGLKFNFPDYKNKALLDTLEFKLWTNEDSDNTKFKLETDKFYDYILEHKESVNISNRFKLCLEDYGKYRSNIKPDSNILASFLVVN